MDTKELPTADVLSVVTGRLMGDIGGVYEVLNWMTSESLFTHQLPRVGREATPAILAAHPLLQHAINEAEQVTTENWEEWRDTWVYRYGAMLAIPKLSAAQHERIDAMSELVEKVHPSKIIVVTPPAS